MQTFKKQVSFLLFGKLKNKVHFCLILLHDVRHCSCFELMFLLYLYVLETRWQPPASCHHNKRTAYQYNLNINAKTAEANFRFWRSDDLFLKASFNLSTYNYMSLWLLPLSLQSSAAASHLLRSMQLYLCAVMELLADNTLTAYYSGPIRSQRALWEKQRERELLQTGLLLDPVSSSAVEIMSRHLFYMWSGVSFSLFKLPGAVQCGEGSPARLWRKAPGSEGH